MGRCSRLCGSFLFLGAFCAALLGCTRERDLVDEQVRQLCAKDGGVRVYEKTTLPSERFNEFNEVRVPARELAKDIDQFLYDVDIKVIKSTEPQLVRYHFRLYRRSDEKLLGESISYSRRGGDFPGPGHPTAFHCPEFADIKDLAKATFVNQSKVQ